MWESRNSPFFPQREYGYDVTTAPAQVENIQVMADAAPSARFTPHTFSPFSQFGEGVAADVDFDAVQELANGKSESEVLVQPNGTMEDALWTLVKQNGEVMVYTFGTSDELAKAMNGHVAHVYASTHDGLEVQLLPLRLFKNADQVDTPGMSGATLNPPTIPQAQVYYYQFNTATPAGTGFPTDVIISGSVPSQSER